MAPEEALITVVALLWGPTAIWILYRLARGRSDTSRLDARQGAAASGSASASNAVQALVDEHGFWVCSECRSFNRPEARRCYGCGTDRDLAIRPLPAGTPGTFLVPVMGDEVGTPVAAVDEAAAATGPWREEIAAAALMTTGTAAPGTTVGVPVMDDGLASAGAPVLVTVAAADGMAARGAPGSSLVGGASEGGAGASGQVPSGDHAVVTAPPVAATPVRAAASSQVGTAVPSTPAIPSVLAGRPADPTRSNGAVCPFLGLESDPSTWYDFPDPGNLCHAVRGGDRSPLGFIRRLLTGRPGVDRLQVISAQQQRTTCLTAEHRSCGRYLAAMSIAARPTIASPVATATATPSVAVATTVTAAAPLVPRTGRPSAQPTRPVAWTVPVTEEPARTSEAAARDGSDARDGAASASSSAPSSRATGRARRDPAPEGETAAPTPARRRRQGGTTPTKRTAAAATAKGGENASGSTRSRRATHTPTTAAKAESSPPPTAEAKPTPSRPAATDERESSPPPTPAAKGESSPPPTSEATQAERRSRRTPRSGAQRPSRARQGDETAGSTRRTRAAAKPKEEATAAKPDSEPASASRQTRRSPNRPNAA